MCFMNISNNHLHFEFQLRGYVTIAAFTVFDGNTQEAVNLCEKCTKVMCGYGYASAFFPVLTIHLFIIKINLYLR